MDIKINDIMLCSSDMLTNITVNERMREAFIECYVP
jgi:hypothetical protein